MTCLATADTTTATTTTATTTPSTSRERTLIDRLQTQWHDIRTSPTSLAQAALWFGPVDSLDDVLAHVGFHRAADDHAADAALVHLVRIARDDDLAARVVLQRILPPLVAIATRRSRMTRGGPHVLFGELAAAAWLLIRNYPVDRRPAKVASNLVRDAEYDVFVRPGRRVAIAREDLNGWVPDHEVPPGHGDSLVIDVLTLGRQIGMPRHDLRLLTELASGRCTDDIGASLGVTARTVRRRRAELAEVVRAALAGHEVQWPPPSPGFYRRWEIAARWADVRAGVTTVAASGCS